MEYASFILGVLSVIFILVVVGIFRMHKRVENQESRLAHSKDNLNGIYNEIENLHRRISEVSELDNRRIDGEIDRVNKIVDDIYRTIDSRFDKFENKIQTKSKQLLKD